MTHSRSTWNGEMSFHRSNICCPRDCVSRHNGGTSGAPLKPLRVDSALSCHQTCMWKQNFFQDCNDLLKLKVCKKIYYRCIFPKPYTFITITLILPIHPYPTRPFTIPYPHHPFPPTCLSFCYPLCSPSVPHPTNAHWENYVSISFHIEWDMIVVTVFLQILNQMEFHLVQNRKKNCFCLKTVHYRLCDASPLGFLLWAQKYFRKLNLSKIVITLLNDWFSIKWNWDRC